MVKLRDLQYLVAVDHYRHFGKAAHACAVSQPTLSGQISKLEQQLGIQIFERHSRKVIVTAQGKTLIDKARSITQQVTDFESCAKNLLNPLNTDVHMGLIPTLAPYLLPHIMPSLNRNLPDARFYLHEEKTEQLVKDLQSGKLDCIILPNLNEISGVDFYHLFNEELLLAISYSHSLSVHDSVTLEHLKDETLLTLSDGHCLQQQTMDYCFYHASQEDSRFQATSLETLRHMVSANLGLTLIPKLATLDRCQDEGIKYISFEQPQPSREIIFAIRSDFHNLPLIRKMVNLIRTSWNELEEKTKWMPECLDASA